MGFDSGLRNAARALLACGYGVGAALAGLAGLYACCGLFVLLLAVLVLRGFGRAPAVSAAAAIGPTARDDHAILRALLDQAPTPLLVLEADGRLRALNRASRQLFSTDDHVVPVPPPLTEMHAENRLCHGDRRYRVDRAFAQTLCRKSVVLALVEVEAEERDAEARATKELLETLGHEVMNALAPITSLAETAVLALDAPEISRDSLSDIVGTLWRRAEGLQRFTIAYRAMARLPAPTKAPSQIRDLFGDIGRLFTSRWADRVRLVQEDIPDISVDLDADQITQAIWAVLENAAEAALAGSAPATVTISLRATDDVITARISDSGEGIANLHRARIFQTFFTTKSEGSGIGLSLARQIARSHDGDLVLLDDVPTTFELQLYRRRGAATGSNGVRRKIDLTTSSDR